MKISFDLLMIFVLAVSLRGLAYKLSTSLTAIDALPNYDSQAITPDTWKEIDFIYYDDFPYRVSYSNKVISGCQKTINSKQIFILHCTEHIHLLRPKIVIERLQQLQKQYGWVPINIREFGINNVHAYITAIKNITLNTTAININKSKSSPVIAFFERHTLTVRTYTFKNIKTGTIHIINATPEHRFYVTNKKNFEPIQTIDSDDQLINAKGDQIKLICKNDRKNHCGVEYNRAKVPVAVYNLEIYRKHRYFAGKDQILVHNMYKCSLCSGNSEFTDRCKLEEHIVQVHVTTSRSRYNSYLFHDCPWENCSYSNRRPSILKGHLRTHIKHKPFVCSWYGCDRSYVRKDSLIRHYNKHEKFQCKTCDQSFLSDIERRIHIESAHTVSFAEQFARMVAHLNKKDESIIPLTPQQITTQSEEASTSNDTSSQPVEGEYINEDN